MFFRSILEFLALLMFFAVARSVIAAVGRMFLGGLQSPPPPSGQARQTSAREAVMQSAGELRKDPVCGTFVPIATSLKRVVNGEAVYFCSPDCRDRYNPSKM
jgi:YHS domain-containing protein